MHNAVEGSASAHLASLIMPVWRPKRRWLLDAVNSALSQRDCQIELLVVDDGNSEPVEGLLGEINDPRLRILRIPHGGLSRARNAGMAAARGDRLRFVDADDVLAPRSTARLLALVGNSEDVIGYGATLFCDSELRPRWLMTCDLEGDARIDCLLGRFTVRPFALLFPRAVIEATGAWDPEVPGTEDFDYVLRALDHATVRGDHAITTHYRKHPESATSNTLAGEEGRRRVIDRYFDRHPEARGGALERRAEAMLLATAGRVHLTRQRPFHALGLMARSVTRDPRAVGHQLEQAWPALKPAAGAGARRLTTRRGRRSSDRSPPETGER